MTLTVTNDCPTDVMTIVSGDSYFADYTYYINVSTDAPHYAYNSPHPKTHNSFYGSWATSVPYCPIDFEIV